MMMNILLILLIILCIIKRHIAAVVTCTDFTTTTCCNSASITFAPTITIIPAYALESCTTIITVVIPSTVTSIGNIIINLLLLL